MKRASNVILAILVIMMVVPSIQSCRKGDEDPFLSLRRRKARLVGTWKLDSGSEEFSNSLSQSYTIVYDGSTAVNTQNSVPETYVYNEELVFGSDYTFVKTLVSGTNETVSEGFWSFLGKYDEFEKKETICISINHETSGANETNLTGDQMFRYIFRLKKLSNKEIQIEYEGTYEYANFSYESYSLKTYVQVK